MPSKRMNTQILHSIILFSIVLSVCALFTIINSKENFSLIDTFGSVTIHEVAHTLITGIMGINEGTLQYDIISLSFSTIMISIATKALVEAKNSKCMKIGIL